ncbi:MAG: hypothetical protein ACREIA_09110 [Opitutaceae bacterium]
MNANWNYFLYENPARIERFDLAAEVWLPPVGLPRAASMMTVSDTNAYILFSRSLSAIDLNTSEETPVAVFDSDILDIAIRSEILYFIASDPLDPFHRRIGSLNLGASNAITWGEGSHKRHWRNRLLAKGRS